MTIPSIPRAPYLQLDKASTLETLEIDNLGPIVRHFFIENVKRTAIFYTLEVKLSSPISRIPTQIVKLPIEMLKEYIYLEKDDMIKTILNSLKKVEDNYIFQALTSVKVNKRITPSTQIYPEKEDGFKTTVGRNIFKASIL